MQSSDNLFLSLCIPTNGVLHWVKPVLESIYRQADRTDIFEVIVTDNGDNAEFKTFMRNYAAQHDNLRYRETKAKGFLNMEESFRLAQGAFTKFVNHRMPLKDGTLRILLDIAQKYREQEDKPVVYFSNGVLGRHEVWQLDTFDAFVRTLGIYNSWSGGLCFWREDMAAIPDDHKYNALFPQQDIMYLRRHASAYIFDDRELFGGLPVGKTAKGDYDLYYAFAAEFMALTLSLVRSGDITEATFLSVKKACRDFIAEQYIQFNILHRPCSYDISRFHPCVDVFFSAASLRRAICLKIPKLMLRKIYHLIRK